MELFPSGAGNWDVARLSVIVGYLSGSADPRTVRAEWDPHVLSLFLDIVPSAFKEVRRGEAASGVWVTKGQT